MPGGAIRRGFFFPGTRKPDAPSGVWKERRKFAFRQRPIQPSELYRNIVKPARSEAAIEIPQCRNDHSDDLDRNGGPRLIEDEEIEAGSPGDVDAGVYLRTRIVDRAEFRAEARGGRRIANGRQEGIVLKTQRSDAVEARFFAGSASHQANRQELVQLRQRAQHGDAGIEMRARTELDVLLSVLH